MKKIIVGSIYENRENKNKIEIHNVKGLHVFIKDGWGMITKLPVRRFNLMYEALVVTK